MFHVAPPWMVLLHLRLFSLEDLHTGLQVGVRATHEIIEAWLLHAACPGTCTDVWMGVLLPPLLRLLFPHMWVWTGRAQEVCGWCGTQSALIYFLHLLWFLQKGPEHSWSRARCRAACAWSQLCQHSRGSVRSGGLLLTATFSCSHNDTSPTTSSILVNVESNMVMLTSLARHIWAVMWYFAEFVRMSDEDFCCTLLWFSWSLSQCCVVVFSNSVSWFFLKIAWQV